VISQVKRGPQDIDQRHGLTTDSSLVSVVPVGQPAPDKYRLVAVASTVSDVVLNAGGYLFDHAASGWHVTVYLQDVAHQDALRILGVTAAQLGKVPTLKPEDECPQVIVISPALSEPRNAIGRYVRAAIDRHANLAMWGPAEATSARQATSHHLSAAACAFKQQALIASAHPSVREIEGTETFHLNTGVATAAFWAQRPKTRSVKLS
jgi:hypothetical protein